MKKPDQETLARLNVRIAELTGRRPDGLRDVHAPDFTGSLDAIAAAEDVLIGTHDEGWRICDDATKLGNELMKVQDQAEEAEGYITHHVMACDLQRAVRLPAWQRALALDRTFSPQPIL